MKPINLALIIMVSVVSLVLYNATIAVATDNAESLIEDLESRYTKKPSSKTAFELGVLYADSKQSKKAMQYLAVAADDSYPQAQEILTAYRDMLAPKKSESVSVPEELISSTYTVKSGDSLSSIAELYKGHGGSFRQRMNAIFSQNKSAFNNERPSEIILGSKLTINSKDFKTAGAVGGVSFAGENTSTVLSSTLKRKPSIVGESSNKVKAIIASHAKQLTEQKKLIVTLKAMLNESVASKKKQQKELNESNTQLDLLTAQLNNQVTLFNTLIQTSKSLAEETGQAKKDIEQIAGATQKATKSIAALNQKIDIQKEKSADLQVRVNKLNETSEKLKSDHSLASNKLLTISKTISELEIAAFDSVQKNKALTNDLNSMQAANDKLAATVASLKNEIMVKSKQADSKALNLKSQNAAVVALTAKISELKARVNKLNKDESLATLELSAVDKRISELLVAESQSKAKKAELLADLENKTAIETYVKAKLVAINDSLLDKNQAIAQSEVRIKQYNEELAELNKSVAVVKNSIATLKSSLNSRENELKQKGILLAKNNEKYSRLLNEVEAKKEQLATLNNEKSPMSDKFVAVSEELNGLNNKVIKLKSKIEPAIIRSANLQGQISDSAFAIAWLFSQPSGNYTLQIGSYKSDDELYGSKQLLNLERAGHKVIRINPGPGWKYALSKSSANLESINELKQSPLFSKSAVRKVASLQAKRCQKWEEQQDSESFNAFCSKSI